jgi:predicted protein tyrosine phosphatase
MSRIIITRADEVLQVIPAQPVVAVLSIEHPGSVAGERGAAPRLQGVPQLILCFWDSEQKVNNGPDISQVQAGMDFVLAHLEKGDVLIHCHAGKSRSVAIALGVLALQFPDDDENTLLEKLLEIRPIAAPNIIIVEMVDSLTGRGGKLLSAVLNHPQISEQRKQTEENRQRLLKDRPDLARKIHPEKFPKP